jgi:hypothetical protein
MFFDSVGREYDLEFYNLNELLNSIASVRVIKLEKNIRED